MTKLGVHSEVGRLREVMVHRPDLSLRRLTPENCKALLFDDVLWVKRARQEHDVFVDALRERGVLVHSFGELLAQTMSLAEARDWLLDRRVHPGVVGLDMVDELRGWLNEMPSELLSSYLVGGIARAELPFEPKALPEGRSPRRTSCCRHCQTSCSPATAPAGSMALSPSIPCIGPPGARKRPMSTPPTASIPAFATVVFLSCRRTWEQVPALKVATSCRSGWNGSRRHGGAHHAASRG